MIKVGKKGGGDFTEGPLLSKIILFTLPLIATTVLQLLFNTADTVVVGRWGGSTPEECETALAAVGSCGALTNLIVNLFFGLSVGAGVCVAHDIGAKAYDDVSRVVHTSVVASLISGVVVTVFGLCMARPLLTMMGTDPAVLDQAVPYMCAYFCGMPANMVYNYCAAILRSNGDTTRPLAFLSVAGVINVVLNLITVIVFGLGAVGVGIATAVSQWVSCVLIVLYMMRMEGPCRIELSKLRVDPAKLRKIVFIGLPAGIQSTLFSFSNVLIQSTVNSFGKVVVAGNTAGSNIDGYIYATQNSLYHAALTFVGQNVGARKYDRVKKSLFGCVLVVTVVGISVGGLVTCFGRPLLGLFAPGNEGAINAGMTRLSVLATTYFLCGLMEVGCGTMRGLGKSISPMFISLIGSCLFRVVWIYTVIPHHRSLEVLYLSYPVSWILTSATFFIFCFFYMKKFKKTPAREVGESDVSGETA
ncbi:MAG: MATE family efflux transporter [Clostridia bacterium]|nr:MATE family efflux transporter [Clostridia bacterium]